MPTETTATRLIDANALKSRLITFHNAFKEPYDAHTLGMLLAIRECIDRIDSAPTVETTDDVLARFGENEITFQTMNDGNVWCWDKAKKLGRSGRGKTPLEAVTRLEASLNPK